VIISVDAKTIHRNDWDCCRQPPGFFTQFTVTSSVPQKQLLVRKRWSCGGDEVAA